MVLDVLLGLEPAAITTWYYLPTVLGAAVVGAWLAGWVGLTRLPFVGVQGVPIGLLIGIGVGFLRIGASTVDPAGRVPPMK